MNRCEEAMSDRAGPRLDREELVRGRALNSALGTVAPLRRRAALTPTQRLAEHIARYYRSHLVRPRKRRRNAPRVTPVFTLDADQLELHFP